MENIGVQSSEGANSGGVTFMRPSTATSATAVACMAIDESRMQAGSVKERAAPSSTASAVVINKSSNGNNVVPGSGSNQVDKGSNVVGSSSNGIHIVGSCSSDINIVGSSSNLLGSVSNGNNLLGSGSKLLANSSNAVGSGINGFLPEYTANSGGRLEDLHEGDLKLPSSMELVKARKPIAYRECLKNHAASLGGHATDGCGEFMPSGVDGTLEALLCAACSCHRNFHRREAEGEEAMIFAPSCDCGPLGLNYRAPTLMPLALPPSRGGLLHYPPRGTPPTFMAFNPPPPALPLSASDDLGAPVLLSPRSHSSPHNNKRFRTKFTAHQKQQMGAFAAKLGWRIQKLHEAEVQQFCSDVGVRRHVLKVWMHNNKPAADKKPPGPGSSACVSTTEDDDDLDQLKEERSILHSTTV